MNFVDVFPQLSYIATLVRRCPTQILRRNFVQAYRDWCNQTHWLRADITTDTSSAVQSGLDGVYGVPLSGDPATYLEVVTIRDNIIGIDSSGSSPQEFRIPPGDRSLWNLTARVNRPCHYAYVPEGAFDLWPSPNKEYGLRITAVLQPQDNALFVPEEPLKKFSRDIEAGALEALFRIPGEPWSNDGKAEAWSRTFQSGINNAKADAQRRYQTGSQRAKPRRFGFGGWPGSW